MKQILFILLMLVSTISAIAGEKKPSGNKSNANSVGQLEIDVRNHNSHEELADSVLVIFDKYDRTGPGIIRAKLAANPDGSFQVENVPCGKYYVTIIYLGIHNEQHDTVVTIRCSKKTSRKLELETKELYRPGETKISATPFSITNLAVCSMK